MGTAYLQIGFTINPNIPEEIPINQRFKTNVLVKNNPKTQLNAVQKTAIVSLEEKLILENKAASTIKSYKNHLIGLLLFYRNLAPENITKNQVQQYLLHLIRFKKIAASTQNQIINSVKAYWE